MKRVGALIGLAPALVVAFAGTAYADAPTKTGWWNAASANGVALPMPTTGADDLHVGQGANGPTAYAAVAYTLAGQGISGATLQLKVAANSAVGTIDVVACPTKGAAWKAGGNQPYDARPDYDCAKGIQGVAAADGTTVTFLLDTAQQVLGGYNLAIVPSADAKPFDVDFVKPDATSLVPQADAGYTPPSTDTAAPPVAPPPAPVSGVSGSAPLNAAVAPAAPTVQLQAPAVAGPAVAAPAVPAPAAAAPPAPPAVAAPPMKPLSNRDRYAAGTGLALLAGFLVWAWQQTDRSPRLIGGVARAAGVVEPQVVSATPRGIGRFAALRTAPARPLV